MLGGKKAILPGPAMEQVGEQTYARTLWDKHWGTGGCRGKRVSVLARRGRRQALDKKTHTFGGGEGVGGENALDVSFVETNSQGNVAGGKKSLANKKRQLQEGKGHKNGQAGYGGSSERCFSCGENGVVQQRVRRVP